MSYEVVQRGNDVLLKLNGIGYQKLDGTGKKAIQSLIGDLKGNSQKIPMGGVMLYLNEDKRTSLQSACEKALAEFDEIVGQLPPLIKNQ